MTTMNATISGSRIYGYGRVSTNEQTADNQRMEIEAAGYALTPRRWFADAISGRVHASQRPQFAKLLERLEEGDTLVVSKLDRLGRDSIDVEQTLQRLEGMGVSVVVLQLGKSDLTSTAGKLIRKILGAVADMERDLIVERTQAGQARARAEGKHMGRPSKLTDQQREELRSRRKAGESIGVLAEAYGIGRATVVNACRDRAGT
ncbi:MAG: recombinase family protein [Acidobacteriaceae bacterium]|nr:recombinase family protein [Acidobacteriaceae bacterium]